MTRTLAALLALLTTGDHDDISAEFQFGEQGRNLVEIVLRGRDDDKVDDPTCRK